jgi:hypothetical protein
MDWFFGILVGMLISLFCFAGYLDIQEAKVRDKCTEAGGIYFENTDSCWKIPGLERINVK